MSFLSICSLRNLAVNRKGLSHIPKVKHNVFTGNSKKISVVELNVRFCSSTNEGITRRKRKKNYTYINKTINSVNEAKQLMDKKGKQYFFDRFSDDFETHTPGYVSFRYKFYNLIFL